MQEKERSKVQRFAYPIPTAYIYDQALGTKIFGMVYATNDLQSKKLFSLPLMKNLTMIQDQCSTRYMLQHD